MVKNYNIIISYNSTDDLPGENGKGWITCFINYLQVCLKSLSKINFNILIQTEEKQEDQIETSNTILIAIISPAYLKSGLFNIEYKKFEAVENNRSSFDRIFKVVKEPVNPLDYPEELRNIISFDFFDQVSVFQNNPTQRYEWHAWHWIKMLDIINKISGITESNNISNSSFFKQPALPVKKVYLAYTGKDLVVYREIIYRELIRQNIEVRPVELFFGEIHEIEQQIKSEMNICDLSIHLFGEEYGEIPKGSERSIIDLQNKIAVELSSKPFKDKTFGLYKQFSRLVWISSGLNYVSEKQKLFLDNIKRDSKALKEDEILQVPFDELKEIIQNKLIYNNHYFSEPYQKSRFMENGKGSIYLIYEKNDQHTSKLIAEYLEQQGYFVILSNFEGEPLAIRNLHQESLRICDASLIICENVNLEWVNTKLQDLLKAPGFGRTKPFKAKALYINNNNYLHFHHRLLNIDDSIILASSENFIPDSFYLFLNKLSA